MFSHAAIASLNNLEMMVYNYVIKNRDKVMYMTIRELADAPGSQPPPSCAFAANCSAKATLNFASALNYILSRTSSTGKFRRQRNYQFFKSVNNDEFDRYLERAVDIILSSERIIFVGAGTSGRWQNMAHAFFQRRKIQQSYR
jgi:DNA-binding MurR/RpiR family transcriptional regulator